MTESLPDLLRALCRPRANANVITYSRRQSFTSCPQRWAYTDLEGLRPPTEPRPLTLGSLVHAGLAAAYQDLGRIGVEAAVSDAKRTIAFWIFQRAEAQTDSVETDELASLACALCTRTLCRYWEHDSAELELVGVEVPFRLPLPTVSGRGWSRWDVAGQIDLIVRVRAGPLAGTLQVIDHKTWSGSATGRDRYSAGLACDTQRTAYCWALQTAAERAWGTNRQVAHGMAYNVIRKREVCAPALNQCPRCKGVGCVACHQTGKGAISKVVTDTLVEEYRKLAVTHPHIDPASYAGHVTALEARPESFNFRETLWVDPASYPRWLSEVRNCARAMTDAVRFQRFLRARRECVPFAGAPCAFRALCDDPCEAARSAFRRVPPVGLRGAPELEPQTEDEVTGDLALPF